MACCEPVIKSFFNVALTTIVYTSAMINQFGPIPEVEVWYWDGEKYVQSYISSELTFKDNVITVDHGGPAKGFVKIK